MIPYFTTADKDLGPIHWFGVLVLIGVLLGMSLARWRARKLGLDAKNLESFIWWMLVGGFVGGHVLGDLLYFPDEVKKDPISLLYIWKSQSSFPGFVGAAIGAFLWKRFPGKGEPILPFSDVILSVFPISWTFGRIGCALVHDHPGKAAGGPFRFLAVNYPAGNLHGIPPGPHWNLGLLEVPCALAIAIVCMILWRKPRRPGFYIGIVAVSYAPIRFLLDFLRTGDVHYLGLTPGQYVAILLFLLGSYFLARGLFLDGKRPEALS